MPIGIRLHILAECDRLSNNFETHWFDSTGIKLLTWHMGSQRSVDSATASSAQLAVAGYNIHLCWVPGHTDTQGNEQMGL